MNIWEEKNKQTKYKWNKRCQLWFKVCFYCSQEQIFRLYLNRYWVLPLFDDSHAILRFDSMQYWQCISHIDRKYSCPFVVVGWIAPERQCNKKIIHIDLKWHFGHRCYFSALNSNLHREIVLDIDAGFHYIYSNSLLASSTKCNFDCEIIQFMPVDHRDKFNCRLVSFPFGDAMMRIPK